MSEIRTTDWGGTPALCCPRCGSTYLHHWRMRHWANQHMTIYVVADTEGDVKKTVLSNKASGNKSNERDSCAIDFWCEQCPDMVMALYFVQDKGATKLEWEILDEPGPPR